MTSAQGGGEGTGHWPSWVREASIRKPQLPDPHFLGLFLPNTLKECFSNPRSVRVSREPIQKAWHLSESSFPGACAGCVVHRPGSAPSCLLILQTENRGSGKLLYSLGVEGQAEPRLACFKASGPPCRAAWKRWRGNRASGPPNIHPEYISEDVTLPLSCKGEVISPAALLGPVLTILTLTHPSHTLSCPAALTFPSLRHKRPPQSKGDSRSLLPLETG